MNKKNILEKKEVLERERESNINRIHSIEFEKKEKLERNLILIDIIECLNKLLQFETSNEVVSEVVNEVSSETVKTYGSNMKQMKKFFECDDNSFIGKVDEVLDYIKTRKKKDTDESSSISLKISYLSSIKNFINETGNYKEKIKEYSDYYDLLKKQDNLERIEKTKGFCDYGYEELTNLILNIKTDDEAFALLFLQLNFPHRSDLVSVKIISFDEKIDNYLDYAGKKIIYNYRSKKSGEIVDDLTNYWDLLVKYFDKQISTKCEYLFVNSLGKKLERMDRKITDCCTRNGLKKLTCNSFRHIFASKPQTVCERIENSKILGHSIGTDLLYVRGG